MRGIKEGIGSHKENQNAEKEYEHAISLMRYATELLWQQFGVFMLAETVIIGFLGNALIKDYRLVLGENYFVFIGGIFGFVICILWYTTFQYNHSFYLLRMEQAKRHEKALGFTLFSEGNKFIKNKEIKINGKVISLNPIFAWSLCDYNDETRRANNLVSRAQEKRDVSGTEQQVSRRRNEDRSSSQGQASTASGGIQVAYST